MKLMRILLILVLFFNTLVIPANASNDKFGVLAFLHWNHSWNDYKYPNDYALRQAVKKIKKLGVGFVRIDLPWNDIESQRGVFDYSRYDRIVGLLSKYDIEILAVVGYSPSWAAKSWNSPPYREQDLYRFVSNLASRFKDKIKYWEFWNEPDSKNYFTVQDGMKTYTKLLKVFSTTLRSIIPEAKILHGGMTSNGYYAIKNIFKHGGGEFFDIANIHPFVSPHREAFENELRNKVIALRRLMIANNKDPRIWITEIGCPGLSKSEQGQIWWEGYAQNEEEQSVFLTKAVNFLAAQDGVEKIFWAFLKDNDAHFYNAVDNFGLISQNGSYKPSFRAYQELIKKD